MYQAIGLSADRLNNSVEGIAIWPSSIKDIYSLSPSSGGCQSMLSMRHRLQDSYQEGSDVRHISLRKHSPLRASMPCSDYPNGSKIKAVRDGVMRVLDVEAMQRRCRFH